MKLKNKKTGEIGELKQWWDRKNRNINGVGVYVSPDIPLKQYNSLAELNEEWEDYEDDDLSKIIEWINKGLEDEILPILVNDFVEKLKAWKRLKDKGFRFVDYTHMLGECASVGSIKFSLDDYECTNEDLNLLFGGEE